MVFRKPSKKQAVSYGFLLVLSIFLFPILPLIIGLVIATHIFKRSPTKKLGIIYAGITVLASFFATGVFIDSFPSSSTETESPSPTSVQIEEQDSEVKITEEPTPSQAPITPTPQVNLFKVTRVIDGDTFVIENGKTVRMIGIDTPETVHPSKPVQCYGKEASDKTKSLISGKMVRLDKDVSETDKYGRLLRYVYVGDVFVNNTLVREGFAYSSSYPPDIKHQEMFRSSQRLAQEENLGLWGAVCDISPTPTVSTSTIPVTQTTTFSCSGPDLDCPDFTTQAQAQAFFDGCGFSATYDPMQLDSLGVGDGVPCESLP